MGQQQFPPQHQDTRPGIEKQMFPRPEYDDPEYKGSGKLKDQVALITGGDSGIGRAIAIAFAKEGAHVVVAYLNEHEDAKETKQKIEEYDGRCLLISGDIGDEDFCRELIERTVREFGKLDILINNAAEQHPVDNIQQLSAEQIEKTFRTNIFSFFYLAKAAIPHLKEGSSIINTASITAYHGNPILLDYSSTKGAIIAFTRSLAKQLAPKNIRVNAVAPGPIWTPLIPSTFKEEKVAEFGSDTLMKRAGQPYEVAPCYVFLAARDASYMTGQTLHPNGGDYVSS